MLCYAVLCYATDDLAFFLSFFLSFFLPALLVMGRPTCLSSSGCVGGVRGLVAVCRGPRGSVGIRGGRV